MLKDVIAAHRSREGETGAFKLDQLITGPGGMATGAAMGGLAALLLGGAKPKKLAKNAMKVGGAALVGGLAYKAWRDWQSTRVMQGSAPPAAAAESAFFPDTENAQNRLTRALARAMIAAAKADGHISTQEQARIVDKLEASGSDPDTRAFIKTELARPLDIEAVVSEATTPEIAAELYTASVMAVDQAGEAERAYLGLLAARLRLDRSLIDHIHSVTAAGDRESTAA